MNNERALTDTRPLRVHVVSHTHWDREWYHSAEQFRQRLVALIDALLSGRVRGSAPFLLDGQAIVLEDYLAVRPASGSRLHDLFREKCLEAGPWYVLADGLIPSGEAIVRNLQVGRALVRELGGEPPAVAYCPDTFGHAAALPTIAAGFGLNVGIAWRGLGGPHVATSDLFRWRSASGHEIILYHLPPDGYEFGSSLPATLDQAATRWNRVQSVIGPRAISGEALLMNGADHHALQPDIEHAIALLQRVASPSTIVRSSLGDFAVSIANAARVVALPEITGELRNSYGYTWALQGTFGTRAAQKRNNARVERLLLRDTEPWLALAWVHGKSWTREVAIDGRVTLAQAPSLLQHAWRSVLRAHPHDTLCGCSIDEVARAMDGTLQSARAQGEALRKDALAMVLDHDVVAARSSPVHEHAQVVVRNRASYQRGGIAEIRVVETVSDVAVGPGGANHAIPQIRGAPSTPSLMDTVVQGGAVRLEHERRESPQHYPDDDLVRAHYVVAWIPPVPALGLRVFDLSTSSTSDNAPRNVAKFAPVSCEQSDNEFEMSNGLVRVVVSTNRVDIQFNGRTVKNALSLESIADLGDSYTPSLRGKPEQLELDHISAGARGPLRASVIVKWKLGSRQSGVRVTTTLILDAQATQVRVDVRGVNRKRNHRLRVSFNSDVRNGDLYADAAFGPVRRVPLNVSLKDQTQEHAPSTMPLHRWVATSNENIGASVISDGLAEAEVNNNGSIAITLLRAIGELSRSDLPERPGHAGWPCAIPLAQSIGEFRARFAFALHESWSAATLDAVESNADALLLPLVGDSYRDLDRTTKTLVTGPSLTGEGLKFSTATLAQDGEGIVLRCVNVFDRTVEGAWVLPSTRQHGDRREIDDASEHALQYAFARLDETLISEWRLVSSNIALIVTARSISTLRLRRVAH